MMISPLRFYRVSRQYTEGYTEWHFWRMFPKAFVRFYWYSVGDFFRAWRTKRRLAMRASK